MTMGMVMTIPVPPITGMATITEIQIMAIMTTLNLLMIMVPMNFMNRPRFLMDTLTTMLPTTHQRHAAMTIHIQKEWKGIMTIVNNTLPLTKVVDNCPC
jgi:hypothetical protein